MVVQFLSTIQVEGGVKYWIVHGVLHNAMGLWVKTLQREQCAQSSTAQHSSVSDMRDDELSYCDDGVQIWEGLCWVDGSNVRRCGATRPYEETCDVSGLLSTESSS